MLMFAGCQSMIADGRGLARFIRAGSLSMKIEREGTGFSDG